MQRHLIHLRLSPRSGTGLVRLLPLMLHFEHLDMEVLNASFDAVVEDLIFILRLHWPRIVLPPEGVEDVFHGHLISCSFRSGAKASDRPERKRDYSILEATVEDDGTCDYRSLPIFSHDGLALVMVELKNEGHYRRLARIAAHELLARRIFENLEPRAKPTAQQLDGIKEAYASTLTFICGAAGTRARWLLNMLRQAKPHKPLSDAELASAGTTVHPAFYSCLPAELRNGSLRVDPHVWAQFTYLVSKRKGALKPTMAVPDYFALAAPPDVERGAQDFARRMLAIDAALRDLLQAAQGKAAAEAPAAEGAPFGLTFDSLADAHFRDCEAELRQLFATGSGENVLFYNLGARTVEFESELMRRITASWLDDPRHRTCMQLVEKLLAWQAARQVQVDARGAFALGEGSGWLPRAASVAEAKALASAEAHVEQLDGEIFAIRKKLRLKLQQDD